MNNKTNAPKATYTDTKGQVHDARDLGLLSPIDLMNVAHGGADLEATLDAKRDERDNAPKFTFVDEKGNTRDARDLGLLTPVDLLNIAGGSDSVEILDARRAEHDEAMKGNDNG